MADPRNHLLDVCMCGDYRRDHEQGGSGRCKFSGLGHSDGHGGAGRCDRFRLFKRYEKGDYIPAGFDLDTVENKGAYRMARTPAQIIGNDRVAQLIFEGYAIVPAKVTDVMNERMAQIADGPARTHQEYWSDMIDVASGETAEN